jgi:hypothetical protein
MSRLDNLNWSGLKEPCNEIFVVKVLLKKLFHDCHFCSSFFAHSRYYFETFGVAARHHSCHHRVQTECQAFTLVVRIGSPPVPSPASECCPLLVPGGGGHTRLRKSGRGEPIRTKGKTLWYSMHTIIPHRLSPRSVIHLCQILRAHVDSVVPNVSNISWGNNVRSKNLVPMSFKEAKTKLLLSPGTKLPRCPRY